MNYLFFTAATYISSITFIRSAYIIAGIAISPLLNIKGELAMEMACAAFCIPTSMTIVLLTAVLDFVILDSNELHSIAANIKAATVNPKSVKFPIISSVYCKKKINARTISAGNANLPNVLLTFAAMSG